MAESYRDQVVIEIRQIADLTDRRIVAGYRIVVSPGGTIDLDWLSDQLKAAFIVTDVETGERRQESYWFTDLRTETHWGAAGAQAQFLIETAATLGVGDCCTVR